jgi:hypothetical protein
LAYKGDQALKAGCCTDVRVTHVLVGQLCGERCLQKQNVYTQIQLHVGLVIDVWAIVMRMQAFVADRERDREGEREIERAWGRDRQVHIHISYIYIYIYISIYLYIHIIFRDIHIYPIHMHIHIEIQTQKRIHIHKHTHNCPSVCLVIVWQVLVISGSSGLHLFICGLRLLFLAQATS